jgi:hypothetical protein
MSISVRALFGGIMVAVALMTVPAAPAAAGTVPDWVKELVVPDDGNQDYVVGEELC